MKRYIIDTHIFLWLVFDPERVEAKKLALLKDPKNKIFISGISFWEIALKYSLGKLELQGLTPDELPNLSKDMGLEILEIDNETMASFYRLPKVAKHKDPFDRIIIWKAINEKIILISQDEKFGEYKAFGLKFL